jgi:hypothetical protein
LEDEDDAEADSDDVELDIVSGRWMSFDFVMAFCWNRQVKTVKVMQRSGTNTRPYMM